MEKMNLSLKSIYRLLMTNDFPIYSESVIDEKNRKGQTLLKFWQSLVVSEFRCLPCGQIIWRNDGRRNRYISNLCNRNPEMKLYPEYAKELASQISTATLLNQLQWFSVFLSGRNYKHDILLRRIRELMRLAKTDDPHVSREIAVQIEDAVAWQINDSSKRLFQSSYLLTVLMLYAAAGEAMDDSAMDVLRAKDYSISALWDLKCNPPAAAHASVTYLTERVGMLQDKPLPHQRFFGREEELFNLKEMAVQGRKCLISGVGGIGKTEMLRQLILSCEEEQSIDYIAIVPYTTGIVESFGKVFPDFRLQEAEESFNHILYQLEQKAAEGSKILLLIDNMNSSLEDDPALSRLASLSCAVLISSRRPELEGFETYRICDPSVSTCSLIFRDNYGMPLTQEDRTVLNELLHNGSLRHPLTLRLMARAAHSNNWTVQELRDHLLQSRISLTWVEDEHLVKLDQIYHQLYSYTQIPDSCEKLVELFTLLPRDSYSPEYLADVFAPVISKDDLSHRLDLLAAGGWLDEIDNGYAMHPLIAQCLQRKVLTEARLSPVLNCLHEMLPNAILVQDYQSCSKEAQRISSILINIVRVLTGPVSRKLMLDTLKAMGIVVAARQSAQQNLNLLGRMLRRVSEPSREYDLLIGRLKGLWRCCDAEDISRLYQQERDKPVLPRAVFLDFCLYCGYSLSHKDTALAEVLFQELQCEEATSDQRALCFDYMTYFAKAQKNLEKARNWAKEGITYLADHPECSIHTRLSVYLCYCSVCLEFGDYQTAEQICNNNAHLIADTRPFTRIMYFWVRAVIENNRKKHGEAIGYYQTALQIQLEYFGKVSEYYQMLNGLAVALRRLCRYEESLACMQEILEYARDYETEAFLAIYLNNIAVVCMDLNTPTKALDYLSEAHGIASRQGGIALGEGLKNMARAHGMLGEYRKEKECLAEAVPLLEAAYGPEHPRASAARQRYEELKKLLNKN